MATAEEVEAFFEHSGVKGMKWGVRRSEAALDRAAGRSQKKQAKTEAKAEAARANQARKDADDASILKSRKALEAGEKKYSAAQDTYAKAKRDARIDRKAGDKQKAAAGKAAAKAVLKDAESQYIQNIIKNQTNAQRATQRETADMIIGTIGLMTIGAIGTAGMAALDMASRR